MELKDRELKDREEKLRKRMRERERERRTILEVDYCVLRGYGQVWRTRNEEKTEMKKKLIKKTEMIG